MIKLEAEHATNQQATGSGGTEAWENRVGDAGIGEPSSWLYKSGIFDKRIDALEVHMVENV